MTPRTYASQPSASAVMARGASRSTTLTSGGGFSWRQVRLEGGPLRWFVATPHFHHWHHAADPEGWNRNYAGQAPLVDWLFGTLVLPPHQWPTAYGLGTSERVPQGWLAQLCE